MAGAEARLAPTAAFKQNRLTLERKRDACRSLAAEAALVRPIPDISSRAANGPAWR